MDSLLSYQDDGFVATNQETLEMLNKAMTAGQGVDAGSFTGGRALSLESLDQILVNILHTQDEAVLFQRLKKQPIKSVIHQWDQRTDVGADDGAWVGEGGSSLADSDQTIARKYLQAKYLQTKRTVTLQATMTAMIEDAMALEENAGTLWLIRNVEKALFGGNATIFPTQPDGLDVLIPSTHVIDLRGKSASSSNFEDSMTIGTRSIRDYFGRADLLLSSTMVMQDMQKLLRDRIRFPAQESGLGGAVFTKYPTPFGAPDIKEDVFIKEKGNPSASSLTSARPAQPTITSVTPATGATGSQFLAADAGEYYYVVAALNAAGESVASAAVAGTVVAGGKNTLLIAAMDATVTGFRIFRSKKGAADGSDTRKMVDIAYSGSGTLSWDDLNADLPGTSSAYLLTTDPMYNAIEWAQFLPMMKFNLYPTAAAVYPFLMLLFGGLAVKKPTNQIRIKNVSPDSLGWF